MIKPEDLRKCGDCRVMAGQPHEPGCDVERCSSCGGQRVQCDCPDHDPSFSRWTGHWPGELEAKALGYTMTEDQPWPNGKGHYPKGTLDLNQFHADGWPQIFFVKPETPEDHS